MKRKSWIIGIVFCIGYCLLLKYMFQVILPFALALLCYFMMKPLIDYLEKYLHMKRSAIGISLLLVIYLVLALFLGSMITYGMISLFSYLQILPQYIQDYCLPFFHDLMSFIQNSFPHFFKGNIMDTLQNFISESFLQIIGYFSMFVTRIPMYIFTFFLFVISTFFLVLDYDDMKKQMLLFCRPRFVQTFISIKNQCLKSLWQYIKCQMILMFICFLILLCGFSIMHFSHPLVYAFITALLDSLPFIGVGIVLLPICIIYLLQKAYLKAFYIFLIYLIINMVRSILEPQIMNKQTQVPSFVLLLSMMIHLYFFGVIGIILSPIHMNLCYSLLSSLQDASSH
ncbi:MAG: AI-2E family transporter [Longibaculum sp.]